MSETQREYIRVRNILDVHYRPYRKEEPISDWERFFGSVEPKDEEELNLYNFLFNVNQKLDAVMQHLKDSDNFGLPQAKEVVVSGSGISFYASEQYSAGDFLTVQLFLPSKARLLCLKSEVVRCESTDEGGNKLALKFLDLKEKDRDKLIGYVFAIQREQLRQRQDIET
jgi:c-di-GMP-binding flagellar brake protein YcgR